MKLIYLFVAPLISCCFCNTLLDPLSLKASGKGGGSASRHNNDVNINDENSHVKMDKKYKRKV